MRYILAMLALVASTVVAHAQLEHAVLRPRLLPPPEFDQPYNGVLHIVKAANAAEVAKLCPGIPFPMACAYPREGRCYIVMIEAVHLIDRGIDPDHVLRHERAHCNGWPKNHPR